MRCKGVSILLSIVILLCVAPLGVGVVFSKALKVRKVIPGRVGGLRGGMTTSSDIEGSKILPIHDYNSDDGLTQDEIRRSHEDSLKLYHQMRECQDGYIADKLHSAMDILTDALRLYGPDQLFSSYNGGKDAVVIMHILRAVVAKYSADHGTIYRPKFIYFAVDDEFPEVLDHIKDTAKTLALHLTRYQCNIKVGLQQHVDKMISAGQDTPAFALGTRKADPNCGEQDVFSPSSSWMPAFMRVNPILTWEYGHVWHFLRTFQLPYCCLYDRGYTSLGKRSDTSPNPALKRKELSSVTGTDMYWPAYMLSDWSLERAGRGVASTAASVASATESCNADLNENNEDKRLRAGSRDLIEAKNDVTAGLLIIGDEILNGFTQEVNLRVATKALASIGVPLKRVSIVSDKEEEIVEEVLRLSQKYDYLITSGGVGPTHDDVTIKSIAKALGDRAIVENANMLSHLQAITKKTPEEMEVGLRSLAMLPAGSELRFPPMEAPQPGDDVRGRKEPWPVLQIEGVFVLPGIPQFFAEKMDIIAKHFIRPRNHQIMIGRSIVLGVEENSIVDVLNNLVKEHDTVTFGSYPYVDDPKVKTIITVQGTEGQIREVEAAVEGLCKSLPDQSVLRVEQRGEGGG